MRNQEAERERKRGRLRAGVVLIETNGRALIICQYVSVFKMGKRLINEIRTKIAVACANVHAVKAESKPNSFSLHFIDTFTQL